MNKIYKKVLDAIIKYDTIIILRHEAPDFDASGSQFGLLYWIKDNFPKKKVYALGEPHKIFSPKLYPITDTLKQELDNYLCIVVDVANQPRIDGKEYLEKANCVIKIDHHPLCDIFGDISFVNEHASAAAEIIADMLISFKKTISKECAYYLYSGIDEITKFTDKGVAYYIISDQTLKDFNIWREQVKAFVNLYSGYEEIKIWVQVTEDIEVEDEYKWRVSIRSRGIKINDVATNFNGGGHDNAAGAKCKDLAEIEQLIVSLDNLL